MRRFVKPITVLLVTILLLQPFCTIPMLDLLFGRNTHVALAQPPEDDTVYLPIIRGTGEPTEQAGDPPDFVINSPIASSTVGGTTFFSIQPTNGETISKVTFRAGSTDLGSDTTGGDGFRVFLDASTLTAGATQLTATATGPNGETTKSINVTLVPNPPSSATIGQDGAVLASEIGSVISILPGSAPAGTTVTIDELTQAETTARHGIDWESMGVTFLGAQDVQSSVPISGPFGMVSSAGFGNRVQPGQAVVNYRIAPDADGDGVDEIVVVNTASVAPNGDVIADPVPMVIIQAFVEPAMQSHILARTIEDVQVTPSKKIDVWISGLNPISPNGNTAIWQSEVNQRKWEMPIVPNLFGTVSRPSDIEDDAILYSMIVPPLLSGTASVYLKNSSTSFTTQKISVQVDQIPNINTSPEQAISKFLTDAIASTREVSSTLQFEDSEYGVFIKKQLGTSIDKLTELQIAFADTFKKVENLPSDEKDKALEALTFTALILQSSRQNLTSAFLQDECVDDILSDLALALGVAGLVLGAAAAAPVVAPVALALEAAGFFFGGMSVGISMGLSRNQNLMSDILSVQVQQCVPPPPLCPPTQSPPGPTGMGAAPPPGGPGCGGSGGSGGSSQLTAASLQQTSPVMVKIFSNGRATPFTGMTDPGGYFFVPFIPADEPFTALAIDTATGATRSFSGTGPKTGESVFMFFDFFHDDNSGATPIQIDEVINGDIGTAGELDLYSFTATAGQRIFFDLQEQTNLAQVGWQLLAPDGSTVFNTCFGCSEPGVQRLIIPGTYILTVGDSSANNIGSYQFKLWNVPPPDEFTIAVEDVVADGVPGAGAGRIETPGAQDLYRFTATAGQRVFFDLQDVTGVSGIGWKLQAPNGTVIFDTCLGCSEPGVQTLVAAGTYVLTVDDPRDDSTGTYQFKLWNVPPPDEFTIAIEDVVADGVPGAGAGRIETPGVQDLYRFTATAGQRVFFDQQGATGVSGIGWTLQAPNGTVLFNTCLGCSEPGVQTLVAAGTYVLTIGDLRDDSIGTYQFKLWNVPPPDEFTISVGDVISDGVPAPGAGNIELPGVQDIYRFTATAGQQLFVEQQGVTGVSSIGWKLEAPNGIVLFDTCLGCSNPPVQTLTQAGTYVLTVGDPRNDSTGTYRFQLVAQ